MWLESSEAAQLLQVAPASDSSPPSIRTGVSARDPTEAPIPESDICSRKDLLGVATPKLGVATPKVGVQVGFVDDHSVDKLRKWCSLGDSVAGDLCKTGVEVENGWLRNVSTGYACVEELAAMVELWSSGTEADTEELLKLKAPCLDTREDGRLQEFKLSKVNTGMSDGRFDMLLRAQTWRDVLAADGVDFASVAMTAGRFLCTGVDVAMGP